MINQLRVSLGSIVSSSSPITVLLSAFPCSYICSTICSNSSFSASGPPSSLASANCFEKPCQHTTQPVNLQSTTRNQTSSNIQVVTHNQSSQPATSPSRAAPSRPIPPNSPVGHAMQNPSRPIMVPPAIAYHNKIDQPNNALSRLKYLGPEPVTLPCSHHEKRHCERCSDGKQPAEFADGGITLGVWTNHEARAINQR